MARKRPIGYVGGEKEMMMEIYCAPAVEEKETMKETSLCFFGEEKETMMETYCLTVVEENHPSCWGLILYVLVLASMSVLSTSLYLLPACWVGSTTSFLYPSAAIGCNKIGMAMEFYGEIDTNIYRPCVYI